MAVSSSNKLILIWDLKSLNIIKVIDDYAEFVHYLPKVDKLLLFDNHNKVLVFKSMILPDTYYNAKGLEITEF